jgi:hypothetical protein
MATIRPTVPVHPAASAARGAAFFQAWAAAVLILAGGLAPLSAAEPSSPPAAEATGGWRAGVGRVKITPQRPMWLSGYAGRDKPAQGTLTDLWAKALVIEDAGGRRALLVTLDLVGIDRALSQAACRRIEQQFAVPRSAMALCVSHTHTGPVVGGNLSPAYALDDQQQQLVAEYTSQLEDDIVRAAGEAMRELQPAELSWGVGAASFAVNRRNNPEGEVPQRRREGKLVGPVDHEAPVLAVRGADGELVAVVFGYACHATVLDDYAWSGDWPGFAQLELERRHPGATAMFCAGCGADQNPLPRRSVALAKEYGKQMADGVDAALSAPLAQLAPELETAYEEIALPLGKLPTRAELEATAAGEDAAARNARLQLERLQRDGRLSGDYPYPIQAWRLGKKLAWTFLGGEVVVDYALRIKHELSEQPVWITAYANDVMAYIPSRRVLEEGGYEGGGAMMYYGLPAPWDSSVEERIVDKVVQLAAAEAPTSAAKAAASTSPRLAAAAFKIDATPPMGTPLCDALCKPAAAVDDPLSARGLVLVPAGQPPIVLVALDWVGVGNEGQDAWREALAKAAGTTVDRVAVHALHQHDAPGCDFAADRLAAEYGLGGKLFGVEFARQTIDRAAAAVAEAAERAEPISHISAGEGVVEKVASNRRCLGPDGKVKWVRFTACTDPEAIAQPEGIIDPKARTVGFWNGDRPVAILTYYATHPQSYYCQGRVSCDFPGLARAEREAAIPEAVHIHFNGAGGNIGAGKYNDGSPQNRPVLAHRLAAGMAAAWEAAKKTPIDATSIAWDTREVALPPAAHLDEASLLTTIENDDAPEVDRLRAVRHLTFLRECRAGRTVTLSRLRIGGIDLLHLPGELFVEYQLAAAKMRPDSIVCVAAYGDYGPGYIGLHDSYSQGGYETSAIASRVAPSVEGVLMRGISELMK